MVLRLVLCLDGTWNTADGARITNIVRIRDLIDPRPGTANGADEQRVYYHSGVGTGLTTRDKLVGGATGSGLEDNIRGAYKFLSQNFKEGCELYLFGFSRGAFTARSLVGYLTASGLLRPELCTRENEGRAWKYYNTRPDARFPHDFEALKDLCFPNVRVRCVGVFDTVGALGVPLEVFGNWNQRRFQFHDVTLSSKVDYAFHALAIDEKRGPFGCTLWQYPNHRDFKCVEQVWFPGVHSNVGGGYENRGLSDRTLAWMLARIEKKDVGLKFLSGWNRTLSPSINGTLYESRKATYTYSRLRPMIRVINQCRPKLGRLPRFSSLPPHAIPMGEMLDATALMRWKLGEKSGAAYCPPNLEEALNKTFDAEDPVPIPIVDDTGRALDWVSNDQDLEVLKSVLPTKYLAQCDKVVHKYRGDASAGIFSTPYEAPRIPISPR